MSFNASGSLRQEKMEMQGLNDKLAKYMDEVKHLKNMGRGLDPNKYHEAMSRLEDELRKLKALYENELDKLRRKLDDANRERAAMQCAVDQNKGDMTDLQNKLQEASNQNRRLADDIDKLQRRLADKDKEASDLKHQVDALKRELDQVKPGYQKAYKDMDDMRRRLADEQQRRKEAEERVKQLQDKMHFDKQKHDQEHKDMSDRLQTANDLIKNLENKLRNSKGDDMANMMKKLREANAADMAKYQKETEDKLNKNMAALKKQIDEDAKEKERLKRENARLEEGIRQLQRRMGELEGENKSMRDQVGSLQKQLADCKQKEKDLEERTRDLQNLLMDKTKDYNQARDAQASLRAEIDTYRRLLEVDKDASRPATQQNTRPPSQAMGNTNRGGPPTEYYDRYCREKDGPRLPKIQEQKSQGSYSMRA